MANIESKMNSVSESAVRLIHASGQSQEGRLSELTDTGIMIDFLRAGGPEVTIGQSIQAVVVCNRVGTSVQVSGRIIARTEETSRLRIRIELNTDDLTALALLVDRRGHQRVEPKTPLQARICTPAGESLTLANIDNISKTGISLGFTAEEAARIQDHTGVFLICLLLPEDEETLEMACIVRKQEFIDGELHLGLEFATSAACRAIF
ncbi:MAG: hypothetical protein ACI841_003064 [Planctomycetota bacterium]|jgi:hypothetical protein